MEIELWLTERDGTFVAPLRDANIAGIDWELNAPGALDFSIDPLAPHATAIEGAGVTEVQVWMDGELAHWQVPWGLQGNSRSITCKCEGLMSYFDHRFVDRMSLLYTSLDQWQIAWDLITYAQSESVEDHRDLNINAAFFTISGVPRSRDYKRDDHALIHDLLKEFDSRTLKNGFDWEVVVDSSGGRFWTPYYPRKGALKANAAVLWTPDGDERNVTDFSWNENFQNLATLAYVTGGSVTTGTSSIKKEGKFEDVAASAYWGQMQKVISEGTELDEDWLEDRAEQEVERNKVPELVTEITSVTGMAIDTLKIVETGDWVPVKIDHGRIQVDALHRIEKIHYNGKDGTVDLKFGEEVIPA